MEVCCRKKLKDELKTLLDESNLLYEECLAANREQEEILRNAHMRLESLFQIMSTSLDGGNLNERAESLLVSICMGSILECVMQLFLLAYSDEYKDSSWQKWTDFKEEETAHLIDDALKQAVEKKAMTSRQRKSALEEVKKFFRKKRDEPAIESVTLSDLTSFYLSKNVIDDEERECFKKLVDKIRNGRNCVHVFSENTTNNTEDVLQLLTDFEPILFDLRKRAQYKNGTATPCGDVVRDMLKDYPDNTCLVIVAETDDSTIAS